MNPFDVVLCTLFLAVFLSTVNAPSRTKWIAAGVLFGVGLLNKYTFLALGFSLFLSLMVTKQWRVLRSRWLYISGGIAFGVFLPHVLWQVEHGWPTVEFVRNATRYKNLALSPLAFMSQLTLGLNPFTLPLWLSGLLFLLLPQGTKKYRFLGWMAVIFVFVYMFQNSKFFYVLPVFPLLLGSGAVAVEQFSRNHRIRWPKWAVGSTMIISALVFLPLAVPVLPVEQFVAYSKTLGLWDAVRMQKGEGDTLPIHFVYRFGWEETAESVGRAYDTLTQNERDKCAILASWYGIAGAIDHFGPRYGLSNAICPNNSYWMWGTHGFSGEVVLAVGYGADSLEEYFGSVEQVASVKNTYAYDVEICLCKNPKASLEQIWDRLKRFI